MNDRVKLGGPCPLCGRQQAERATDCPGNAHCPYSSDRQPRPATTMLDGSPVTADHRELRPDGMQKDYVVLSADERAKGFVRPVRHAYVHDKCGAKTTMGQALAETYARDPSFYSGTFCTVCRAHFPVGANGKFTWYGTIEKVGT